MGLLGEAESPVALTFWRGEVSTIPPADGEKIVADTQPHLLGVKRCVPWGLPRFRVGRVSRVLRVPGWTPRFCRRFARSRPRTLKKCRRHTVLASAMHLVAEPEAIPYPAVAAQPSAFAAIRQQQLVETGHQTWARTVALCAGMLVL